MMILNIYVMNYLIWLSGNNKMVTLLAGSTGSLVAWKISTWKKYDLETHYMAVL